MSDTTPDPAKGADDAKEPQEGADGERKTFDAEYVAKLRKEAAAARVEAKANADAAKRLAEIDEKSKTDAEKVADRIKAAEERAAAAEAKALRLEVATSKGLTPAQAKRLTGSTVEELEADADELLEAFGGSAAKAADTKPRVNLRPVPGAGTSDDGAAATLSEAELDKLADELAR